MRAGNSIGAAKAAIVRVGRERHRRRIDFRHGPRRVNLAAGPRVWISLRQSFSVNDASGRVLEKCGFELEGYLRKHCLKDGRFIDAKAYGLVR
jgi:hypothetical protein